MKKFYGKDVFLENEYSLKLYDKVKDLPIYDYHCHMSAKEIYEDNEFTDIGQIWLGGDHYKWRAMRQCGIDEQIITQTPSMEERFMAFASILPKLVGSPLYHWAHMELRRIFNIEEPLSEENAKEVFERANAVIKGESLRPSKMLEAFNVEFVGTTDDPIDDLNYHKKLKGYKTKVMPTYRPDRIVFIEKADFADYMKLLGAKDFDQLLSVSEERLLYFIENGCKLSDHALSIFPNSIGTYDSAKEAFTKKLEGKELSIIERDSYIDYILSFFIGLYKKYDITMQLHMSPLRNANSEMFKLTGPDSGFDTIGSAISPEILVDILDRANSKTGLPRIILYSLNPEADNMIGTVIGAFGDKIQLGSAWWFNDSVYGIKRQLQISANNGLLGNFIGMLTDSRSFTSYVRFDYFRRILCSVIGDYVEGGQYPSGNIAFDLVKDISCYNVRKYIGI